VILIRFPDAGAKRQALGRLPGRFPFKSWSTGEMMVPEEASAFLAVEGIAFAVNGPAIGERSVRAAGGRMAAPPRSPTM
jgi:hypothetical protein